MHTPLSFRASAAALAVGTNQFANWFVEIRFTIERERIATTNLRIGFAMTDAFCDSPFIYERNRISLRVYRTSSCPAVFTR